MSDIEERLAQYVEASAAERQTIASEVAADRPDLLPLLGEVQTLAAAIDRQAPDAQVTPDRLARLAAHEHVTGERPSQALRERLQQDADSRSTYYALRDRVEALDGALPDPYAHFKALTGHAIDSSPTRPKIHRLASARAQRPASSRQQTRTPQFMRYAIAACFGLIALYGGLAIASRASVSELDRLGAIDVEAFRVEGFGGTVRGEAAFDPTTNEGRYLRALDLLEEARGSMLGLFPDYDPAVLMRVRRLLEAVVLGEPSGSFLQLEASFVLGKTLLLLGDEVQARPALLRVVEYGGRQAPEATRILASLQARE